MSFSDEDRHLIKLCKRKKDVVCDGIISNDVTITSVLHSDLKISGISLLFLVEWAARMDCIKNYKTMFKVVKVMHRKL